jgi:prepilin-type N-terminal cleavage/methylation domain-containing protein
MRKGFTLLELLVVVGIMGMLGVAAAGGYSALVRGMSERGAVAAASSLLRAAKERAQVDRSPTVVYCCNRLIKAPTGSDDNGVVVGIMTAVRRAGRISYIRGGDELYDEFADLDRNYEYEEDDGDLKKGGGFRLFKVSGRVNKMEYSIVSDRVLREEDGPTVTLFSGGAGSSSGTNLLMSAFVKTGASSDYEASWSVGDGYGMEFAEVQLPDGYIFGRTVPSTAGGVSLEKVVYFDPDQDSSETIEVWSTKPSASGMPQAFSRAGEASADNDKGV